MFVSMTEYTLLALDNNKVPMPGVGGIHTRVAAQHLTAAGSFAATQPGTRFVRIATDVGIYVDFTGLGVASASGDFIPPGGSGLFEILRGGTGVVISVASTAAALPTTGGGGGGGSSLADNLIVDAAGVYWILQDQGGGTFVYYKLSTLTVGTPTAPVAPAATSTGSQVVEQSYDVITAATGYAVGDILLHIAVLNVVAIPPAILTSAWINITQGTVLTTAPTAANIVITPTNQAVTAADGALTTIGAKADAAYAGGGGSASAIALYKGIYNALVTALPAGANVIGGVTVAQLPVSLGRQTAANSVSTVTAGRTISNYNIAGGSITGASQSAVTAGQATAYLNILNPIANAGTVYVDMAGGTASSTNGIPLIPGAQLELPAGVANAVTLIGTAGQPVEIWGGV